MDRHIPVMLDVQASGNVPRSVLSNPVFNQTKPPRSVVGAVQLDVDWMAQFESVSPSAGSILAVLVTGGGDVMSFEIFADSVMFLGDGDQHDQRFDDYVVTSTVSAAVIGNLALEVWHHNDDNVLSNNSWDTFAYSLSVYPTASFEAAYKTNLPVIYTAVASVIFAFIIILFVVYDLLIKRRQQHVVGEVFL